MSYKNFLSKFKILDGGQIVAAFVASFALVTLRFLTLVTKETELVLSDVDFASKIDLFDFSVAVIIICLVLIFITVLFKIKRIIPYALILSVTHFAVSSAKAYALSSSDAPPIVLFNVGLSLIVFIAVRYVCDGDKLALSKIKVHKRVPLFVAIGFFAIFTAFISYCTILRHKAYFTSTFDFGVFCQMFARMKETFLPETTVERNKLLSHFGVHFSPFFYLLLPFYMMFSQPECLLVLQASFVGAGVFAVYKICNALSLSPKVTLVFEAIYIFFPSLSCGCFYDFHENKFLTVLILWTAYFIIRKKTIQTFVFALLVLSVKEDAMVYVIAMGLFVLAQNEEKPLRKRLAGVGLIAMSLVYFFVASSVITYFGGDIMSTRFKNYWSESDPHTLSAALKTCIKNFGYVITEVFTEERLEFLIWMFVPVSAMPFFDKSNKTLLLLSPIVLVNLMPEWKYQYNINYQYTFGAAGLIIFASIVCFKGMTSERKKRIAILSLILCLLFTVSLVYPSASYYIETYYDFEVEYDKVSSLLNSVPDGSVICGRFLMPHLSAHDVIYVDVYPFPDEKVDFVAVDTRYDESKFETYMGSDYELYESASFCKVYKRITPSAG